MPSASVTTGITEVFPYKSPERDVVKLYVVEEFVDASRSIKAIEIRDWLTYDLNSHFLTPTDAFSFTVPLDGMSRDVKNSLVPGVQIAVTVNGHVQMRGYIDDISASASRGSGAEWTVSGRDLLSPVVDCTMDPRVKFSESQSLLDVIKGVFTPFGWTKDDDFEGDQEASRNIITGQTKGAKLTPKTRKPVKNFKLHQTKPHDGEGCFGFAARVAQRHGLWIWLSPDGDKVIVSKPDFDQEPRYSIRRTKDGQNNNVISGHVRRNISEQPTIIVAEGEAGGQAYGHSRIKAYMLNPAIDSAESKVIAEEWKARGAVEVTGTYTAARMRSVTGKPLFLHSDECKTQQQLENFVRREMALRMRKTLECTYTVEGHEAGLAGEKEGSVWSVDTCVDVKDDVGMVNERMWVLSRTFRKSRSGGSTTEVELIRPYTMEF